MENIENIPDITADISSFYKIAAPCFKNVGKKNFSIKSKDIMAGDKPFMLNWYNPLDKGVREVIVVPAEYVRANCAHVSGSAEYCLISRRALMEYVEKYPTCYYRNELQKDTAMYNEYLEYVKANKKKAPIKTGKIIPRINSEKTPAGQNIKKTDSVITLF